jgi:hypothetical protein
MVDVATQTQYQALLESINQSLIFYHMHAAFYIFIRRYKEEKFDSIIYCFTAKKKKLHVIQHQFNVGPKRRQTILIGFRNIENHHEIVHLHRLDETLIKEIKSSAKCIHVHQWIKP